MKRKRSPITCTHCVLLFLVERTITYACASIGIRKSAPGIYDCCPRAGASPPGTSSQTSLYTRDSHKSHIVSAYATTPLSPTQTSSPS